MGWVAKPVVSSQTQAAVNIAIERRQSYFDESRNPHRNRNFPTQVSATGSGSEDSRRRRTGWFQAKSQGLVGFSVAQTSAKFRALSSRGGKILGAQVDC